MNFGINKLRQRLESQEVVVGAAVPFFTPELVEWCGLAGFDWVFLDAEHGPLGVETCYSMVRAADAVDMASIVRVPSNDPATILSYAESRVDGVMVPHVKRATDAEALVDSLRYPPHGSRGALSTSRAAGYGLTQAPAEYFNDERRHAMALPLIEDEAAVPHAGAIADVTGIEAIFIGPGDLAMSMGYPGQPAHPDVTRLIDATVTSTAPLGVALGTTAANAEAALEVVERGFRIVLVSIGALMASATRELLTSLRHRTS
jgi:2-keto-3-deoxy-L-rhamnonate aldolase RhmA